MIASGNKAIALGALAAGCRFFAGYPITPSSDILKKMADCLPERDGIFYQAEDELAAIGMVAAASACGWKAMTATSGPGLSLMQEEFGWVIINEIPLVVVDAMRVGPSTGQPTKTASADINCLINGRHGDAGDCVIVLTPSSVQECFDLTVTAFNLSEKYRMLVFVAVDGYLSGLKEKLVIPKNIKVVDRTFFPTIGTGKGVAYAGLIRDTLNRRCSFSPIICRDYLEQLSSKRETLKSSPLLHCWQCGTAKDYLFISYGLASRAAKEAALCLANDGYETGYVDLKIIWPLPDTVHDLIPTTPAKNVIIVENNGGQLANFLHPYFPDEKITTFANLSGEPIKTSSLLNFCLRRLEVSEND